MEYDWDLNSTSSFGSLSRDFFYANILVDEINDGNLPAVKKLLNVNRVNPNIVVPELGVAPLHLMAGQEDEDFGEEATKIALKNGGHPNVRSEEGLTPVHIAAMWGRCRVLEVLLSAGGDPSLLDYKMLLNAEEYALRERQWPAYGVLTTFSVLVEDEDRLEKYLDDDDSSSLKISKDRWNKGKDHGCGKYQEQPAPASEDYDWLSKTMEVIPLNDSAIDTIQGQRRKTRIYQCPGKEYDTASYASVNPKLPKRSNKTETKRKESEMFFCEYSESSFQKSKESTRKNRSPSEISGSVNNDADNTTGPSNKVLCKMSRIFLFMLKKKHIYQRIK